MRGFITFRTFVMAVLCLSLHAAQGQAATGFLTKWGSQGTGNGQFNEPSGIAVNSAGQVYVVDKLNDRVQKFDGNGTFLLKWGLTGSGDGEFSEPRGIAVDSQDQVYVVDTGNDRVQKFTDLGGFVTKWGLEGTGDGEFTQARGIAIDNNDFVYVTDDGFSTRRIQKFSDTGAFITKWGSPGGGDGQFQSPRGIAVDNLGFVYVTDSPADRVQKFTDDGGFVGTWGSLGSGPGEYDLPIGIAIGSTTWIVDQNNNRIQECDLSGTFLDQLGSFCDLPGGTGCTDPDGPGPKELGDGQFDFPQEIAVDGDGNVYVTDTFNHRVQKFGEISQVGIEDGLGLIGPPRAFPNPASASSTVQFHLATRGEGGADSYQVQAEVFDLVGRLVRRLHTGPMSAGDRAVTWDGRTESGSAAPPGIFLVRLVVDGTAYRTAKLARIP